MCCALCNIAKRTEKLFSAFHPFADGIERRKRKRKRRGRQRRNSRGKIIGSRYGEADYVEENESMERIIKFGSMPSYRCARVAVRLGARGFGKGLRSLRKAWNHLGLGLRALRRVS